jgi:hypothetical protein
MPIKSKAQARFLYAKKPKLAKKFAEHTKTSIKNLPEKVNGTNRNKRRKRKSAL